MNKTSLTTLPAALALALTLGACGGGDDPVPPPHPTPSGPFITDCFTVNKAITFAVTSFNVPSDSVGANKSTTEPTTYEGKPATGQTFFYPAGTTTYKDTNYWTIIDNGVKFIAYISVDGTVIPAPANLFFKQDMAPGETLTDANNNVYTFVGFEKITLAGKTFSNTCRIKEKDSDGNSDETWYAPGYGIIKQVDAQSGIIVQYSGDL